MDDHSGTSVLLLNNKKATFAFEAIKDELQMCTKMPLSLLERNRPIKAEPHFGRDRFYELVKGFSFNKAVNYSLNAKYDVAVLGVWSEDNYGSEITYYAIYRTLKDMSLEVLMVERPLEAPWRPNSHPVLFKEFPYDKNDIGPLFASTADMHSLNSQYNAFVLGSDQMWHNELFRPFAQFNFLDYIHENKNKVSYATSFGKDTWDGTDEERALIKYYMNRLDSVSVRERSGVDICKDKFGVEAQWVLDPIFLCNKDHYHIIASRSEAIEGTRPFIAAYILDVTDEKQKALEWLSEEHFMGLHIITDTRNPHLSQWRLPLIKDATIEDWLAMFINASIVVTDFFHGICLASLFHKPFYGIINENRGATRFYEYATLLGLEGCLVNNAENIVNEKKTIPVINWDKVDLILLQSSLEGKSWLLNLIRRNNRKQLSVFDILRDRIVMLQSLEAEVKDCSGMIRHHEDVFHMAFGEIESLKHTVAWLGSVRRFLLFVFCWQSLVG